MARLNLILDEDTFRRLDRHAKRSGKPRAALARELLRDGLAQREAAERRKQLAADYAAGRGDARAEGAGSLFPSIVTGIVRTVKRTMVERKLR